MKHNIIYKVQPVLVFDLSSILTDIKRIIRKLLFCYLASLVTTVEDQAGPEEQETTCQLSSRHWPLGTAATCLNRHSFVAQPVCTHGLRLIQPLASGPGALSEQVSISVQVAQMAFLSPFLYALERSFTFLPRRSHNQKVTGFEGPSKMSSLPQVTPSFIKSKKYSCSSLLPLRQKITMLQDKTETS